jgi:hypothetical protein
MVRERSLWVLPELCPVDYTDVDWLYRFCHRAEVEENASVIVAQVVR